MNGAAPNKEPKVKKTLTVSTPVGTFTRATNTTYSFVVVRESKRAGEALAEARSPRLASKSASYYTSGVSGRWVKDGGFAVTWHGSEQAARNAADKPYAWDRETKLVGVFPVDAS